jgi:hypothetical protein
MPFLTDTIQTRSKPMSDKKLAIGTKVVWKDESGKPHDAEVLRHGRDSAGCYTEIETDDGEAVRVHRSCLRTFDELGIQPWQANG